VLPNIFLLKPSKRQRYSVVPLSLPTGKSPEKSVAHPRRLSVVEMLKLGKK
jgi:hypothetical protein